MPAGFLAEFRKWPRRVAPNINISKTPYLGTVLGLRTDSGSGSGMTTFCVVETSSDEANVFLKYITVERMA